jgi:predicted metal-dependent hydrolase
MAKAPFKNQPLLTHDELRSRLGELHRAIDEYNRGWWFESHETLEDLWMVTPLPERDFMQAIIQLAAAYVHFARREYPGILKLLAASADKLRGFQPECLGVRTDGLFAGVEEARAAFEDLGAERFLEYDEKTAPRIEYARAQ